MLVGLDHLILACADPDGAAAELEAATGLAATGGGRHDAQGTFNRLVWLGDTFIELIGVFDPALAEGSWLGRPTLEALSRAAVGYVGLAMASNDLAADVVRLRALGSSLLEPVPGERQRPDGDIVRWQSARPTDLDPELGLCFLIEHDLHAAEWRPADRAARASHVHPAGTTARLVRVEVPVRDIRITMARLLRSFGLQFRPSLAGHGARDASLGAQTLRVSRAERPLITLRAGTTARRVSLLGCDWELVPADA